MIRKVLAVIPALTILTVPAIASAHVIVTPAQVGIGQELTFNISVPNEQSTPVVNLKLEIPQGVTEVVPTEKDGWTIQTTSNNSTTDPELTAITWTGDSIPVGEREDFSFSAQVPGNATNLDWKAYQTYGSGTVVHWDQTPNGKSDDSVGDTGPYSVTHVINDLTSTQATTPSSSGTIPLVISLVALLVSVASLLRPRKS
jgi:uncharacterized protein YcnI